MNQDQVRKTATEHVHEMDEKIYRQFIEKIPRVHRRYWKLTKYFPGGQQYFSDGMQPRSVEHDLIHEFQLGVLEGRLVPRGEDKEKIPNKLMTTREFVNWGVYKVIDTIMRSMIVHSSRLSRLQKSDDSQTEQDLRIEQQYNRDDEEIPSSNERVKESKSDKKDRAKTAMYREHQRDIANHPERPTTAERYVESMSAKQVVDKTAEYLKQLPEVSPKQQEIKQQLIITFEMIREGYSKTEIAKELGVPNSTITNRVKKIKEILNRFLTSDDDK